MVKQLKVRLENVPGALWTCVRLLAERGVDIKALDLTARGSGTYGEAQMIVSPLEQARQALEAGGYAFEVQDAIAVEMDDEVGGLASVLGPFAELGINIVSLYAFVTRVRGKSLAVVNVDAPVAAKAALAERRFPLITQTRIDEGATGPRVLPLEDHFGGDFIW